MKQLIDILTTKPHIGGAFALGSGALSFLTWCSKVAPVFALISGIFGSLVGGITLYRMLFKRK